LFDAPFPGEPCDEEVLGDVLGVLFAASTTTVPCMKGWTVQKYVNVPGWLNVCEPLWPLLRIPVSKLPSRAVAVCGLGPSLDHVSVSPTWIVVVAGEKLKSTIVTPGSPAR
jgi:hypothetical protein